MFSKHSVDYESLTCDFMHDLYIAESRRDVGLSFVLYIAWFCLHSLLDSKLRNKL